MSLISCVMPCKNRQKVIGETISSLLKQSESDWELVIIDDHSDKDDETEKVILKFNDNRIKYFRLPDDNGYGIAAARNYGNMMSQGDFIAVADSDDIIDPDRFKHSLEAFANGADIVYGDIALWNEKTGEITKRPDRSVPRPFDLEYFKNIDYIPHPTVAYRRKLALDFPYNSFFRIAEDYDMLSRLAVYGYKFVYVDKEFVKYRQHETSISKDREKLYKYKSYVQKSRNWE